MNSPDARILGGLALWAVRALLLLLWSPALALLWARGDRAGLAVVGTLLLLCLAACRPSPPD